MSYVKHLVSKKKRRFIEDGFDLDLAYIKPNIVAMGFPSEHIEGVYRNHLDDVYKFLELKHKDKYKLYNLCSEKSYDPAKFGNRVSVYGFDDHNAPPFELILPYCKDMDKWLSNEENVAIVHCKAGKGRTGVMICAYLLYKKYFTAALDAMNYYADARTENKKGVTIPSQRRYITYFGFFARDNFKYVPKTILLNSVTFIGVPTINSGTCSPSLIICQTKVILHKSKSLEVRKNQSEIEMDIGSSPVPICGDIKIDVFHKDLFKKERMLVFWFNTHFLEKGVTLEHPDGKGITDLGKDEQGNRIIRYEIPKRFLDKANKDKKHKFYPESFMVRLNITIPRSTNIPGGMDGKTDLMDGKTDQMHGKIESSNNLRSTHTGSPINKDKSVHRERAINMAPTHRGTANVRDATGLSNIVEERNSSALNIKFNRHNKNSPPYTNNPSVNPNETSRFYVNANERIRANLDDESSGSRRCAPLKAPPPPPPSDTLSAHHKNISISMEALQLEDAEHLSSSDDEDDELFL